MVADSTPPYIPPDVKKRTKEKRTAHDNQAELEATKTIVAALEPLGQMRRKRAMRYASEILKFDVVTEQAIDGGPLVSHTEAITPAPKD